MSVLLDILKEQYHAGRLDLAKGDADDDASAALAAYYLESKRDFLQEATERTSGASLAWMVRDNDALYFGQDVIKLLWNYAESLAVKSPEWETLKSLYLPQSNDNDEHWQADNAERTAEAARGLRGWV